MTAEQMAAFRRTVNAYVTLLMDGRGAPYIASVTPLYVAFGISSWGHTDAEWELISRIQVSFRRIAEQIARSRGWEGESWFLPDPMTPDTQTHVLRRTDQPRASQGHLEIA